MPVDRLPVSAQDADFPLSDALLLHRILVEQSGEGSLFYLENVLCRNLWVLLIYTFKICVNSTQASWMSLPQVVYVGLHSSTTPCVHLGCNSFDWHCFHSAAFLLDGLYNL
jgi:hypothetical protein